MPKHQFEVLTIVRLRAPEAPVPDTSEDEAIQAAHLAYLADLQQRGVILINGPVKKHDDSKFLGMSIYKVGLEEAKKYAMDDPGAKAGWFEPHVDTWLVPYGPVSLGTQIDLEV